MGAATAYYLAQQGVGATVVEREALAAAASGKAGGFLALDWNDSSPVGPLARRVMVFHESCTSNFDSMNGKKQLCSSVGVSWGLPAGVLQCAVVETGAVAAGHTTQLRQHSLPAFALKPTNT